MRHCVDTLLTAGPDAEIILIDDGSTKDDTPAICDEYAAKYPGVVRAIHQENGGHGEGVNQGIRHAAGIYYKVVDSDDWLDTDALAKVLDRLRLLLHRGTAPDLMLCNYVYEHTEDGTSHTVRYTNVFPQNRLFTWMHVGRFRPDQNILMHSVIYRTEVLRRCGMVLPKHTFYVDNIFIYQPLPYVKSMYYMDLDLYRYFIGRADQSVNESVMVKAGGPAAAGHPVYDRLPGSGRAAPRAGPAAQLYDPVPVGHDGHQRHLPDPGRAATRPKPKRQSCGTTCAPMSASGYTAASSCPWAA